MRPLPVGPRRLASWFLAATVLYLLVEVPFAALLLDTLGSNPDIHEIERIERAGRLLSGIAVALAVVGVTLPKALRRSPRPWLRTSAVFVAVVGAIYVGEKLLIDAIAHGASDDFRRNAAFSVLAKDEAVRRQVLGDVRLPDDDALSKTALGFVPIVASMLDDPSRLIEDRREAALAIVPDDVFPDLEEFEETVLAAVFAGIASDMRETIEEKRRLDILFPSPERMADEAFDESSEYTRAWMHVRKDRVRRGNIPVWVWHRDAARHSRNWNATRGIQLPASMDWQDYLSRERYVANAAPAIRRAQADRMREARNRLGDASGIAPTRHPFLVADDAESFARNEPVQALARERLGLGPGEFPDLVHPDMSRSAKAELHRIASERAKLEFVGAFVDEARNSGVFGADGAYAGFGENAVRIAVVPLLALTLSLLGGLLHLGKAVNFALLASGSERLRAGHVRLAAATGIVLLSIVGLTEKPKAFEGHELLGDDGRADLVSAIVRANMSLQPRFRPIADGMGRIGPFSLLRPAIEGDLERYASWADPATDAVASTGSIPIPTPRPGARPTREAGVPVPTPRPTDP